MKVCITKDEYYPFYRVGTCWEWRRGMKGEIPQEVVELLEEAQEAFLDVQDILVAYYHGMPPDPDDIISLRNRLRGY